MGSIPTLPQIKIVEINGKATKGMTSFDALEAIQVDPVVAVVAFKSKGDGVERTVRAAPLPITCKGIIFQRGA